MARPCPACGGMTLIRDDGAPEVCSICFTTAPGADDVAAPASATERRRARVGVDGSALRSATRAAFVAADDTVTDRGLMTTARRSAPVAGVAGLVVAVGPSALRGAATTATVLAVVVLVGALVWRWWRLGARRWGVLGGDGRRRALVDLWERAVVDAEPNGLAILRVRRLLVTTADGTRCLVELADGTRREAFFWAARPRRGSVALVRVRESDPRRPSPLHLLHVGTRATGHGIVRKLPRASWRLGRGRVLTSSG